MDEIRVGRQISGIASFQTSSLTKIAIGIRLALISGGLSSDLLSWVQSSAVRSIICNPEGLVECASEATAFRSLIPPHRFVDAYDDGGQVHLQPLLLALLETFYRVPYSFFFMRFTLSLVIDYAVARTLEQIATIAARRQESSWEERWHVKLPAAIRPQLAHVFDVTNPVDSSTALSSEDLPILASLVYFCSPITILSSSCFGSFQNVTVLLVLQGVLSSFSGSPVLAGGALAAASYLHARCALFVLPAILSLKSRQRKCGSLIFSFLICTLALQILSLLLVGQSNYLRVFTATHGEPFLLKSVPSLSVVWYLHMEMFGRFHSYFRCLLGSIPFVLVTPLALRLYRYPIVMVIIFWFLSVVFSATHTLYDWNLLFCLMLLEPRSLVRMRFLPCLVSFCAWPVPVLLYSAGYWMWLEPSNGEANYIFFQCLAYNIFIAILLVEFTGASLSRDKALRWTEKNDTSMTSTALNLEIDHEKQRQSKEINQRAVQETT